MSAGAYTSSSSRAQCGAKCRHAGTGSSQAQAFFAVPDNASGQSHYLNSAGKPVRNSKFILRKFGGALPGFLLVSLWTRPAWASAAGAALDGAHLSLLWVLPFAGILGSLAVFPAVAPNFWHRFHGLVAVFWALAFLIPFGAQFGAGAAFRELVHVLLLEYIPFIALIGSLFAIAGGIYAGGDLRGSPGLNSLLMLTGMGLASFAGTTGAAMILIRPLIRANHGRRYKVHTVVFFIFLVCNIGGALTPLGDPPLFLGYLEGVDFFWPLKALWPHMLFAGSIVLAVYYLLDSHLFAREGAPKLLPKRSGRVSLQGLINIPILVAAVALVAVSGSNGLGEANIFGTKVPWMSLLRDAGLVLLACASLALTPRACREQNEFNWEPVLEVAQLFAAIFITILPAIAILQAGPQGALAPLHGLLGEAAAPNNMAYFWLTGLLSSFLDNAPAYLVFFNAAGGDARELMGPLSQTLTAISAGAVFMGANTYIGNAPNFMVKAIAEDLGIKMPSFVGFLLWSGAVLMPVFLVFSLIFFA
jgi:Na+/H+ antiporter NhaD/arsenite permease-like protein